MVSGASGRPPRPIPQPNEAVQPAQQKPKVPALEKHLVDQLSQEEQDALNSKFQEATDAEKKVKLNCSSWRLFPFFLTLPQIFQYFVLFLWLSEF